MRRRIRIAARRPKAGRDHVRAGPGARPGRPVAAGAAGACGGARGALAGLLAAAVALGVAELVAGDRRAGVLPGRWRSGDAVITLTPGAGEGTSRSAPSARTTRSPCVVGTLVVIAVYALLIGLVALRNRRLGDRRDRPVRRSSARSPPSPGPRAACSTRCRRSSARRPAIVALLRPAGPADAPAGSGARGARRGRDARRRADASTGCARSSGPATARAPALDRRRFFLTGGVALGVAAVTGGGGRLLQRRFDVAEARAAPRAADAVVPGRRRCPRARTWPARSTGLTPLFTAQPRVLPGRHRDQRPAGPARRTTGCR